MPTPSSASSNLYIFYNTVKCIMNNKLCVSASADSPPFSSSSILSMSSCSAAKTEAANSCSSSLYNRLAWTGSETCRASTLSSRSILRAEGLHCDSRGPGTVNDLFILVLLNLSIFVGPGTSLSWQSGPRTDRGRFSVLKTS